MGITLGLRCARAADVHVGRSPLAELMSVPHILAEPDHHPEAQCWTRQLGVTIAPSLADETLVIAALVRSWSRQGMSHPKHGADRGHRRPPACARVRHIPRSESSPKCA
ncbi:DUF5937 family protein [Streptomyces sp. NPDC005393]|uniref:DUF5937 family protein n=1 Tax=Streptomyces sp. NPDC005393 TaxID=3157041 RepID=UPI0033A40C24